MVTWWTGDLSTKNIGPVVNSGEDDMGLIEDFLTTSLGTARPRQLFIQGEGFAEQCNQDGGAQLDFLNNYLFCSLRDVNYTNLTPSLIACPDLTIPNPIVAGGGVYGVANSCVSLNDVLEPGSVENNVIGEYQAVGVNAPYRASIEHQANVTHNWHSVINAWDSFNTFSRYCATSNGRLSYYYNLMVNAFGSVCNKLGAPSVTLDVPNNQHGGQFVNFMKVGNSVMRTSSASIHFGVANAGRVRVRLYDVTGRVIKTVADRNYEAGNDYAITWNGTDDAGNQVARGVYFARIEFAKGAAINGRVVVLR